LEAGSSFTERDAAGRTLLLLVWGEVFGLLPMVGDDGVGYVLFPCFLGLAGYTTWVLLLDKKDTLSNPSLISSEEK
jgi:hypothetical protein